MFAFRDIEISPELPTSLVALEDMKSYLGVTGSGEDALITRLVLTASAVIEKFCNRYFVQRTITETINTVDGVTSFVLGVSNVSALTSISFDGAALDTGDIRLAKTAGILRKTDGSAWTPGEYVAEYTAGPGSVPEPVKQAAYELVRYLYGMKDRDETIIVEMVPDVGSTTYGGQSVLKVNGSGVALPGSVAAQLAPFQEVYTIT